MRWKVGVVVEALCGPGRRTTRAVFGRALDVERDREASRSSCRPRPRRSCRVELERRLGELLRRLGLGLGDLHAARAVRPAASVVVAVFAARRRARPLVGLRRGLLRRRRRRSRPRARRAASTASRARGRRTAAKDNQARRAPLAAPAPLRPRRCSTSTAASGSATSRRPRAVEAVAALREAGKGVAFVTNDARHGGEEFVRKLWRLGFRASLEEVVTVGGALQHWLAERRDRGGQRLRHRLGRRSGATSTDAGLRDRQPHRPRHPRRRRRRRRRTTTSTTPSCAPRRRRVLRGAGLRAAPAATPRFPMPDGPWPGTGAIVAAVEHATRAAAPTSVGKPEARALPHRARPPGRRAGALVVGDRLDADLAGAHAAELDAAIVLTGATTREEAEAAEPAAGGGRRHARRPRAREAEACAATPTTSTRRARATGGCSTRWPRTRRVHRVATGRVKPRMGSGRPVAPISKVRTGAVGAVDHDQHRGRGRSTPT